MAGLQYVAKNLQKVKPLSRVHARHKRQTRQTDGFAIALAKRNGVTFG